MAGRSELPSGKPSSLRRTELRLGEPEPPAKKRIIDVAVLVEPCQLARVSGYRAYVRCSLPPAGVFSESGLGALWQAFARSLSGRRRQGRREWLPMASPRQGSAAARHWRSKSSAASHVCQSCRGAHSELFFPWDCPDFQRRVATVPGCANLASLTQVPLLRSVISLKRVTKSTSII